MAQIAKAVTFEALIPVDASYVVEGIISTFFLLRSTLKTVEPIPSTIRASVHMGTLVETPPCLMI